MSALCCPKPYEILRLIYVLQYLKQAGVAVVALCSNEGKGIAAYKQRTQRKDQNMTICFTKDLKLRTVSDKSMCLKDFFSFYLRVSITLSVNLS